MVPDEEVDFFEMDEREIPDEETVQEESLHYIQRELSYQYDRQVNFGKANF